MGSGSRRRAGGRCWRCLGSGNRGKRLSCAISAREIRVVLARGARALRGAPPPPLPPLAPLPCGSQRLTPQVAPTSSARPPPPILQCRAAPRRSPPSHLHTRRRARRRARILRSRGLHLRRRTAAPRCYCFPGGAVSSVCGCQEDERYICRPAAGTPPAKLCKLSVVRGLWPGSRLQANDVRRAAASLCVCAAHPLTHPPPRLSGRRSLRTWRYRPSCRRRWMAGMSSS